MYYTVTFVCLHFQEIMLLLALLIRVRVSKCVQFCYRSLLCVMSTHSSKNSATGIRTWCCYYARDQNAVALLTQYSWRCRTDSSTFHLNIHGCRRTHSVCQCHSSRRYRQCSRMLLCCTSLNDSSCSTADQQWTHDSWNGYNSRFH